MRSPFRVREHLKELRRRGTSADDAPLLAPQQPPSPEIEAQYPIGTLTRSSSDLSMRSSSTHKPHVGSLSRATTLVAYTPQVIWEEALASPKISEGDREVLKDNGPSDSDSILRAVTSTIREIDRKRWVNYSYTWKGRTYKIFGLLNNVTKWVERFKSIGDIIVQYDPIHSALPWAAVRMLLQVCSHSALVCTKAKPRNG